MKKDWWKNLFDEKYIKTYIDYDSEKLTNKQVSFLIKNLGLKKESRVLDLACGYGRHSIGLASYGYKVTGLDYSNHLLKIARKNALGKGVEIEWVQKDMREVRYLNKFDAVINMFTSFGYFEDEKSDLKVIKNVHRALKPKGVFLIDLNNPIYVIKHILEDGKKNRKNGLMTAKFKNKLSNEIVVETENTLDPISMRWIMKRSWREKGKIKSYKSSIRLFNIPELTEMLESNRLKVEKIWGNFNGDKFHPLSSRIIILAKKF